MASVQPHRRLVQAVAALSTPAICAFAVLAATGQIAKIPALLGAFATILLTGALLRVYFTDLTALERFVRGLERGENPPSPTLDTDMATNLLSALNQLRRSWRGRADAMGNLLSFHEILFESLPDPLLLVNGQRRIVRANQAARTIFGGQLQNRDLAAVLRNPAFLAATDRVLAGEQGQEVEFSAPVLEREFRAMIEPLRLEGEDGAKAALSLHDVTALRRMEQMRGDFVANASHELRTPLSAIIGFIETLQGSAKDDPEARERFLAIMLDQASRMSRLVADLLNLSRIELNEHSLPSGRCDIGSMIRRVVEGLEPTARKRRITVEMTVPDGLPEVNGKEDELSQIFQNLVDNALKYGREGTSVTIEATLGLQLPALLAERGVPALAVLVTDQGDGIAREDIPRLTERFFRVDTARSRRLGGTGLGLAIVKHIVNRHRGALVIDSTLGKGSVFTVFLPLAKG